MKTYQRKLQTLYERIRSFKMPATITFVIMGIGSTLWFLFRVIPKPQRATYPCMKVAAPIMSSFVIYLLSLSGIVLAFRQSKRKFIQARYLAAAGFLVVSVVSAVIYFAHDTQSSKAATPIPDAPNTPMGTAQGIMPGRVSWAWCADAICQGMDNKGKIGADYDTIKDHYYFNHRFVYQPAVDSMVNQSIRALSNQDDLSAAWDTIFKYFNQKKNGIPSGYKNTQKIFIKINLTGGASVVPPTAYYGRLHPDLSRVIPTWQAHPDLVETNPFTVLSVLRQLVYKAGVPENMIYIGDPLKNVYKDYFDYWKKEFPNLNVLANNYYETGFNAASLGRVPVVKGTTDRVFYSNAGLTDKLYTVTENADYVINMAVLKGHNRNGITLCAKNHFGSQTRKDASHLHASLITPDEKIETNGTYKKYRILVDLMGNKYLGGNTLLFLVDALVSAEKDWDGPAIKFGMAPFNNSYPSSIFMSLDQVALESVCFDFLRTEFDVTLNYGHKTNSPYTYGAVDDYLHQAADSLNWPTGIKYKPNGDGIAISSLGTHEHWNNASEKKYSRNINAVSGKGIELYKISFAMPHTWDTAAPVIPNPDALSQQWLGEVKVYPNPANDFVVISCNVTMPSILSIEIYDLQGKKIMVPVQNKPVQENNEFLCNTSVLSSGTYFCHVMIENNWGKNTEVVKISIQK